MSTLAEAFHNDAVFYSTKADKQEQTARKLPSVARRAMKRAARKNRERAVESFCNSLALE